ncbi:MAG: PKD domain-containing protein [Caldilineales bacterium]|nr:PKD domain-containing protein [Caldilineales bacterium]
MNIKESWDNSSPVLKIAIVVVVIAIVAALLLVVASLFNRGEPAVPTPTPGGPGTGGIIIVIPTPGPADPTITAIANTPMQAGPGYNYPLVGILAAGQKAEAVGVNQSANWIAISVPDAAGDVAWVESNLVQANGIDNLPIITAPPVPTPTAAPPASFQGWKGEYFANQNLQAPPALVRDDPVINFDWGDGSPAPEIPANDFSVRWTMTRDEVAAGTYRFSAWVDDGLRIWVDDVLIIDGWVEGSLRNYSADVNVTKGTHTIRVDYFEATGNASIRLDIGYVSEYPDWKGEYFDNPNVEGEPEIVRNDVEIDFDWGTGAPAAGIPADNYSVRWSRKAFFAQGNYRVVSDVSGGVRLWLDGRLLLDSWQSAPARQLQAETGALSEGYHDLRVDFFKTTGVGAIDVGWQPLTPAIPPTAAIAGSAQTQVGQPTAYNGAGSTAAPGSQIVRYAWDFGDGVKAEGVTVSHVFQNAGTYNVSLVVTDDKGLSGSTVLQTSVVAQPVQPPPNAIIRVSQNPAPVGQTILFDGRQSTASSSIISYRWEFGDGFAAEGPTAQYAYNAPGVYLVTLAVVDEAQNRSQSQVQMTISQPQATQTPTPQPTQPPPPTATPTPSTPPLEGITWRLNDTLPDTEITTLFNNLQVTGSAGCNTYTGTYSVNGANISIVISTTTNASCPPEVMQQEQNFLAQLQASTTYSIDGALMQLAGNGAQLNYTAAPQPR